MKKLDWLLLGLAILLLYLPTAEPNDAQVQTLPAVSAPVPTSQASVPSNAKAAQAAIVVAAIPATPTPVPENTDSRAINQAYCSTSHSRYNFESDSGAQITDGVKLSAQSTRYNLIDRARLTNLVRGMNVSNTRWKVLLVIGNPDQNAPAQFDGCSIYVTNDRVVILTANHLNAWQTWITIVHELWHTHDHLNMVAENGNRETNPYRMSVILAAATVCNGDYNCYLANVASFNQRNPQWSSEPVSRDEWNRRSSEFLEIGNPVLGQ